MTLYIVKDDVFYHRTEIEAESMLAAAIEWTKKLGPLYSVCTTSTFGTFEVTDKDGWLFRELRVIEVDQN